MQSLANYRSMHMRMQQLAAEGALEGDGDAAARDRAAAGVVWGLRTALLRLHCALPCAFH